MKDVADCQARGSARIEHFDHTLETESVKVRGSRFSGAGGVDEVHLLLEPRQYAGAGRQLDRLLDAYRGALAALGLEMRGALLRRFFCSDIVDQAPLLAAHPLCRRGDTDAPCAISVVGQPPMPPAKVALWAYHASAPDSELDKCLEDATLTWQHNGLTHHWTAGLSCPQAATSAGQTRELFEHYEALLRARGLSLADNVVRTWLFVRDIDKNYAGMVDARREFYRQRGLTPDTHFIASTGIAGRGVDHDALVTMDAYAIGGPRPGQISFLAAPELLSPTHVYGTTFERGAAVAYRDRRHVLISGTASIDQRGELLHAGDISRQLRRTLTNIEALLKQAGAGFPHISEMIAYVRDPTDQAFVERRLRDLYENIPVMVVVAAVCRPGWLVEIECQATAAAKHPTLSAL